MTTKYQKIIDYIETLKIGSKLSIKLVAKEQNVSEGTAYRAIKEAESLGLVSTTPKAGTIRIEPQKKTSDTNLALKALIQIVNGTIITENYSHDLFFKEFVIANSDLFNLSKSTTNNTLCIVGNRPDIQELAIEHRMHLLITDDAEISSKVISLAKKSNLLIIKTPYDAFKTTHLIHIGQTEKFAEHNSFLVKDYMKDPIYLYNDSTVADLLNHFQITSHTQFPVVDDTMKIIGAVNLKNVYNVDPFTRLANILNHNFLIVSIHDSIKYVLNSMIAGKQYTAFVVENEKLVGILSLQDILSVFYQTLNNLDFNASLDNIHLKESSLNEQKDKTTLTGITSQSMLGENKFVSFNAIINLIYFITRTHIKQKHNLNLIIDNLNLRQLLPITENKLITISAKTLNLNRSHCLISIEIKCDNTIMSIGLIDAIRQEMS